MSWQLATAYQRNYIAVVRKLHTARKDDIKFTAVTRYIAGAAGL